MAEGLTGDRSAVEGEDQVLVGDVARGEVLVEGVDHGRGERDGAIAGRGLQWPELGDAAEAGQELAIDLDDRVGAEEAEPVAGDAEDLSLPHAGAGGNGDQRLELIGQLCSQGLDLGGGERDDAPSLGAWQPGAPQGLAMILRSRIADRKIPDTTPWITPIVDGASGLRFVARSPAPSSFTQDWTSDGRMLPIDLEPKIG